MVVMATISSGPGRAEGPQFEVSLGLRTRNTWQGAALSATARTSATPVGQQADRGAGQPDDEREARPQAPVDRGVTGVEREHLPQPRERGDADGRGDQSTRGTNSPTARQRKPTPSGSSNRDRISPSRPPRYWPVVVLTRWSILPPGLMSSAATRCRVLGPQGSTRPVPPLRRRGATRAVRRPTTDRLRAPR